VIFYEIKYHKVLFFSEFQLIYYNFFENNIKISCGFKIKRLFLFKQYMRVIIIIIYCGQHEVLVFPFHNSVEENEKA